MFLPWSFFSLNLFYLALDVLMATSFAATLSHIARNNGNYAQSIRWIKQAGTLQMVKALWTSFGRVTGRHWLGLLATFIGGYALVGLLIGAKSGANIATADGKPFLEVRCLSISLLTTKSRRFRPGPTLPATTQAWKMRWREH